MITCWQIEPLLPGLSAYYGEDQPVDIFFHIHQFSDFTISEAKQEFSTNLNLVDLEFWVHTVDGKLEQAASLTL